ncbi:hypothetical protein [Nocardia cerradoensis]|uniref:hypothetical protein n=1 Tax=Nocardia cerradoensis TaxID=85688 RepID=UPI0016762471|nr:hypothetical protein [Nocardia cerradoensis]
MNSGFERNDDPTARREPTPDSNETPPTLAIRRVPGANFPVSQGSPWARPGSAPTAPGGAAEPARSGSPAEPAKPAAPDAGRSPGSPFDGNDAAAGQSSPPHPWSPQSSAAGDASRGPNAAPGSGNGQPNSGAPTAFQAPPIGPEGSAPYYPDAPASSPGTPPGFAPSPQGFGGPGGPHHPNPFGGQWNSGAPGAPPGPGGTDAPTTAFGARSGLPQWPGSAMPGANSASQQQFSAPHGNGRPEPDWHLGVGSHPAPQRASWGPPTAQHPHTALPQVPAEQQPRRRKALLLSGIGVLVVVAIGVTVAVVASRHSGSPAAAGSGKPSMVSALSSGNQPPPPPSRPQQTAPQQSAPKPQPGAAPPPMVPGYQVVQILDRGAAYDAPAEWKVDPIGTAAWGSGSNPLEIAGLAQDGKNYCPNYTRTNAFLTMSPQADPAAAAADIGARMAKFGWSNATVAAPAPAQPMVSLDGQLHGAFVETTGSAPPPAPGCATTFAVYTFAFPSENGNFVMTVAADTGVDKSVDKETAKRILSTIRPLPAR